MVETRPVPLRLRLSSSYNQYRYVLHSSLVVASLHLLG
jgi:hypothetical protein